MSALSRRATLKRQLHEAAAQRLEPKLPPSYFAHFLSSALPVSGALDKQAGSTHEAYVTRRDEKGKAEFVLIEPY
jgi:hypothetical protein